MFALLVDCTSAYTTEKHEGHILCKLQRGLTAVKSLEHKYQRKGSQAIHFAIRPGISEDVLGLNGRAISSLSIV
jgi:hypothetical protein